MHPHAPQPRLVDGRYVVEALVGEGGMAVVYRVRHLQLGTQHSLKVLRVGRSSVRQRLLNEGRVQAALRHTNVVSVTDVLQLDGAPALVMEYVDGPSLATVLEQRVRLARPVVDALAHGLFAGVAAAHELGVVHRDLKPSNVLLDITGSRVTPKVADFGLVKWSGGGDGFADATRTGSAMGTPAYMAPEQIRDAKHVDERADVWSLGVILFELATGQRPFGDGDILHVMGAVAHNERPSVAALAPELPGRMVRAIEGALTADPAQRIGSVRALGQVWFDGATVDVRAAFDPPFVAWCQALGAGGEDAASFLRRSFKDGSLSSTPPHRVRSGGTLGRTQDTWVPPDEDDSLAPRPLEPPDLPSVVPLAGPITPSTPPNRPQPSSGRTVVLEGLLAVGVLALAVSGLGAAWLLGGDADSPVGAARVVAPVVVIEAPDQEPRGVPDAAPARDAAEDLGATAPQGSRAVAQRPTLEALGRAAPGEGCADEQDATAAQKSPVAGGASVRVHADITVVLRDQFGDVVPLQDVPPGTYDVVAFFEDRTPTVVHTANLVTGASLVVRCSKAQGRCIFDG